MKVRVALVVLNPGPEIPACVAPSAKLHTFFNGYPCVSASNINYVIKQDILLQFFNCVVSFVPEKHTDLVLRCHQQLARVQKDGLL